MQRPKYYVGVDVASASFYAAIGQSSQDQNWQNVGKAEEFGNTHDALPQFLDWLRRNRVTPDKAIICMEATGVYNEVLAYFLVTNGYQLAIQPPLEVKKAFKPVGHKTDPVDSRQIAEYAYRYFDQLRLWKPREEILEQIKVLLSTREQFSAQTTAHLNALRALKRKMIRTPLAEEMHENAIKQLKLSIRTLEQEIERLIDQDPTYRQFIGLLVTIPGVGLLLASHLLVTFHSAPQPLSSKHLAAFIGICPYEHRSGTSVYSTPTSRHYGPPGFRKLLYLAALSVRTHQPQFRLYFMRKVIEGKPKQLVINNIANKLVKIICAVIRTGTPYIQGYRSVHPQLLMLKKPLTVS